MENYTLANNKDDEKGKVRTQRQRKSGKTFP